MLDFKLKTSLLVKAQCVFKLVLYKMYLLPLVYQLSRIASKILIIFKKSRKQYQNVFDLQTYIKQPILNSIRLQ